MALADATVLARLLSLYVDTLYTVHQQAAAVAVISDQ